MKPPHVKPRSIADQIRALLHLPNAEVAAHVNCTIKHVQHCRRHSTGPSRPARPGAWTDERIEELEKLWAAGLSCSHIASRLGGVTRNAVIGKVTRLGLPSRATTKRLNPRVRRRMPHPQSLPSQPRPSLSPLRALYFQADGYVPPAEELVIPLHERKTIQTLTESCCRWPIGDPQQPDFHFCGKKKIPGLPYCEVHARRAFQPPQARRRELPAVRLVEVANA